MALLIFCIYNIYYINKFQYFMIYDTSYFIHPRYHVIIKASPRLHRLKVQKYLISSASLLLIALSIDQDNIMTSPIVSEPN